jgi:hypothetical protein
MEAAGFILSNFYVQERKEEKNEQAETTLKDSIVWTLPI